MFNRINRNSRINRINLTGHLAAVYALARGGSPKHFLSAGGDGWVVEWNLDDVEMGKLIARTESRIFSLSRLPDGRLLAGNMDGGLHWINLEQPDQTRLVLAHKKGIFDLLTIGEHLFSAGGDGIVTRWNIGSGQPTDSLKISHASLRALAYSPARGEIAVGASDRHIYLLDAGSLEIKHVIREAHANSVFTIAYAPDERRLLSGGRDAFLRVWDLTEEGAAPSPLQPEQAAHMYTLNHLAFSPDGELLATASRDRSIKIWDAATFQLLKVLDTIRHGGHVNSVNRLLWLEDALISCSDDRTLGVWKEG